MYSDDFEDLEEARRGPRRTYVSSVSQQDVDKLLRENERLKKSLEKEKFFNKLLDQELKDVKEEFANNNPDNQQQHSRRNRSNGSFNLVFLLCLAMAGFIAYTLYFNKQYNLFDANGRFRGFTAASTVAPEAVPDASGSVANTSSDSDGSGSGQTASGGAVADGGAGVPTPPALKDSVPNIIGNSAAVPAGNQKRAATPTREIDYDEAEVEAVLASLPPEPQVTNRPSSPSASIPSGTGTGSTTEATVPVIDTRPVIGRYRVTSKANFYDSPDENTLRNAFIRQSNDKIVSALEDRNGFIYVEFKNDLGYITKGWLSKKDLTKTD